MGTCEFEDRSRNVEEQPTGIGEDESPFLPESHIAPPEENPPPELRLVARSELTPGEKRTKELATFVKLPTPEWTKRISALYPNVVFPRLIQNDLATLHSFGRRVEELRKGRWVAPATAVGGWVLLPTSIIAIPVLGLGSMVLFPIGIGLIMIGGWRDSNRHRVAQEIREKIVNWNARGLNWLHQRKDELLGEIDNG